MNSLIEKRGKEIIIGMFIFIIILLALLLRNSLNTNMNNFSSALSNPLENVHGVLFLAPDHLDNLEMFSKTLSKVADCKEEKSLKYDEQNHAIIPPECLKGEKGMITPEYSKQKTIILTPGIQKTEQGERSILFYSNPDPRTKCTTIDGYPC